MTSPRAAAPPPGCPAFDPTDPAAHQRPDHPAGWHELRRGAPVQRLDSPAFGPYWSVTGHAAATQVLSAPELFTSTLGMRLGAPEAAVRAAAGRMLVVSDGPQHQRVRAALAPWLQRRALEGAREVLRRRLAERLDALVGDRPVEIVTGLAEVLPTWVVCDLLGVPEADWDHLAALAGTAFREENASPAARQAASAGIFGYFAEMLEDRRENPNEDLISSLLRDQDGPGGLTDEEILLNCDGLVNGGLGTTRHAVSGAVLAMAEHPDTWARLAENPHLLGPAVEEVLRWTTPPMHMMRTATRDTELCGAELAAGDRVVLWIPSCNRDGTVFERPDEFLIDRRPNPHLSLGAGPHYCIGAALARLELRTLLQVLLDRAARIVPAGVPVRSASTFLHGLDRLEVTLVPRTDPPGGSV
ncbi:cytochrome P450 [Streptomyces sp. NRRL WC-3742]|uniref:cytochrome P450 n=1 Tax=Streptomyces sp. NRRL WC-3742 TaxID=1463934 RepID=UPI0004C578F9|nr:cytochrome P450 [Streptomyces sp. NRRL WC-3742]